MPASRLSDEEVVQALSSCGIPRRFHAKDRSVAEYVCGDGNSLSPWIKQVGEHGNNVYVVDDDGIRNLFLYGEDSMDFAYLVARSLLLIGVSVVVLHVSKLFDADFRNSQKIFERVSGSLVVIVLGYNDAGVACLGDAEQLYAVQWWIHRRLDDGKVVVLNGTDKPSDRDVWGIALYNRVVRSCDILKATRGDA